MATKVKHKFEAPTDKQLGLIEELARKQGYRYSANAIKAALGKNPIQGINRQKASEVIQFLIKKSKEI